MPAADNAVWIIQRKSGIDHLFAVSHLSSSIRFRNFNKIPVLRPPSRFDSGFKQMFISMSGWNFFPGSYQDLCDLSRRLNLFIRFFDMSTLWYRYCSRRYQSDLYPDLHTANYQTTKDPNLSSWS